MAQQEYMLKEPDGISFFSRDAGEVRTMLNHFQRTSKDIQSACDKLGLTFEYRGTGCITISGTDEALTGIINDLKAKNLILFASEKQPQ